jgi:hypothetical protein
MSDPVKQAWQDVSDGFSSLRQLMKERYGAAESGPDAPEPERERSEAALRAALDSLIAAARDVGERAVDIVKDPEIKAQTKQAIESLNTALTATADQVGDDVRGLLKRANRSGAAEPPATRSAGSPTAPDAPPDAGPTSDI